MIHLLPAILPVGLIILIGLIAGRSLSLQHQTLSQLILYVLSPALVIDSLYRNNLPIASSLALLQGFAITSGLLYLAIRLISKITGFSRASTTALVATSLFPNNGNMGLSVVSFALGTEGLARAVIYMLGASILMFCFGPAILKGQGFVSGLKLIIKLPLIWAIALGIALRVFVGDMPFQLDEAIQKVGAAAIPIALILLGMQLAKTRFSLGIRELLAASIRLLLAPTIAYSVGNILHLTGLDLQVLVLQSAMPTAVSSLVLVHEFGGDQDFTARVIVTSTLLSFISIPFVLWLLTIFS
ncbi:putative permease [Xenococcus sp. PCC 7305]|uniref:AEC family transporter n=1 Tax=Xenococcus sp. PCC 7305 TaxID=102125 RepID=UPI0002ACD19B|nr:AEC family transporter [Xenococcus sp. PCC 7305]ELS01652.1 putative permease [Xenococcus sp. PCC 7305]